MKLKLLYQLTLRSESKGLAGSGLALRASARSQGTTYDKYGNYDRSELSMPSFPEPPAASIFYPPSQKCHKAEIARCTSFDQWMGDCF
jgi:hypothetical protein